MEEVKFLISLNRLLHNLKGFEPTTFLLRCASIELLTDLQITLKTIQHFITELNTGSTAQRSRRNDRTVNNVTAYENGSKASTFIKAEAQLYCPYPLIM